MQGDRQLRGSSVAPETGPKNHAEGGAYPRITRDRTGSRGTPDQVVNSVSEKTADGYTDDQSKKVMMYSRFDPTWI